MARIQELVIVNASSILSDAQVQAKIGPLQKQFDRDFVPLWGSMATPVKLAFASLHGIPSIPATSWAIFLNKHSADPGALGWHDAANGQVFSRVFIGDCIRFGLDWGVTLGHEGMELNLNPFVKRVWRMPDGNYAALEACDPVESDSQAYDIDGHKMSNFVLPEYYSTKRGVPYDFRNQLKGPCPALTDGGYQLLTDVLNGQWTQKQQDRADGLASIRAIVTGHRRRMLLAQRQSMEVVDPIAA